MLHWSQDSSEYARVAELADALDLGLAFESGVFFAVFPKEYSVFRQF